MKRALTYISLWLMAVAISLLLLAEGCSTTKSEGFAIYLTQDNVPPTQMGDLGSVKLDSQPIISTNDIISYYSQTHALKLSDSAYKRLSDLDVPTSGKSFVVCVDKKPFYWGAFWGAYSSQSFDGVTIMKPNIFPESGFIALDLGYPVPSFYRGQDPRNSPEILKSLEQAGNLITKLDLTTTHRLPTSMKGYELYSWSQDQQWHFTLITGTNRNKTLEEIISQDNSISEDGFVKISVVGVEAIKDVLSKIPVGTFVTWLSQMREPPGQTTTVIQLPPQEVSGSIRDYAVEAQLDFQVITP
jgi:hypothetical protein